MKNSIGQEIKVGDTVITWYQILGKREILVGKVAKLTNKKVNVEWYNHFKKSQTVEPNGLFVTTEVSEEDIL